MKNSPKNNYSEKSNKQFKKISNSYVYLENKNSTKKK